MRSIFSNVQPVFSIFIHVFAFVQAVQIVAKYSLKSCCSEIIGFSFFTRCLSLDHKVLITRIKKCADDWLFRTRFVKDMEVMACVIQFSV